MLSRKFQLSIVAVCLLAACAQKTTPAPLSTCSLDDTLPAYAPTVTDDFITVEDQRFMNRDTPYVVHGVNYYPARYPWRRFLTEGDLDSIITELDLLRETGFNTLRLFLWNDALFTCPGSGAVPVSDTFLRLDSVIREAGARDFRLIVTLNDLPDLTDYPLYSNPSHIWEQTRLIIERYRDEAAIMAWDLRNESDIDYGSQNALGIGGAIARLDVLDWLAQTSAFVRQLDDHHLVTAGWLHDSQSTIPSVDFVSFHHWDDATRLRQRILSIRDYTDKPILLEEFGFSTYRLTPDEQGERIQEVIEVAEAENLSGWMIWTAFDFPLDATCLSPGCASVDNAEHHFGVWYSDYTPKPAAIAIQALLDS